jgi:hypothetical protein
MNHFKHKGAEAALVKFASTAFKTVTPASPAMPKPAHTTGTKMPTLPKPPKGPAVVSDNKPMPSDGSADKQDVSKPDAIAVAEAINGGPVQNAHTASQNNAQSSGIKAAMFNFGMLPQSKPLEGEIRPDNGVSYQNMVRHLGEDRSAIIEQMFRSVSTQKGTGSLDPDDDDQNVGGWPEA